LFSTASSFNGVTSGDIRLVSGMSSYSGNVDIRSGSAVSSTGSITIAGGDSAGDVGLVLLQGGSSSRDSAGDVQMSGVLADVVYAEMLM